MKWRIHPASISPVWGWPLHDGSSKSQADLFVRSKAGTMFPLRFGFRSIVRKENPTGCNRLKASVTISDKAESPRFSSGFPFAKRHALSAAGYRVSNVFPFQTTVHNWEDYAKSRNS